MPEILTNVNLIIMENDYTDITHKNYIDANLKQHNFYVDYSEAGGWDVVLHLRTFQVRGNCYLCHSFAPTLSAF